MGKKRAPTPPPASPGPFNPALAGLAEKLGKAPISPAVAVAGKPVAKPPGRPPPARAVVRMERAGRGGKTVTVVEKLGLPRRELEAWLADMKRGLGCGGVVEGDALVLQGDSRERTGRLLEARGVKKVTVA